MSFVKDKYSVPKDKQRSFKLKQLRAIDPPTAAPLHGAHKNPSPETMETSVYYSISINPAVQPVGHKLAEFFCDVDAQMKKIFKNASVEVVPELSAGSRWHFHGLIQISDIVEFFLEDLPALRAQASYEIDTIADQSKWLDYVYKSRHLIEPYLTRYQIDYVFIF